MQSFSKKMTFYHAIMYSSLNSKAWLEIGEMTSAWKEIKIYITQSSSGI